MINLTWLAIALQLQEAEILIDEGIVHAEEQQGGQVLCQEVRTTQPRDPVWSRLSMDSRFTPLEQNHARGCIL